MGGNIARAFPLFKDAYEADLENSGVKIKLQILEETDQIAILAATRLTDNNYFDKVYSLLKFM